MRKLLVLAAAVLIPALFGGSPPASGLPENAADAGHAHTHGPDGLELDRRNRLPAATYSVDTNASWAPAEYDGAAFSTDQSDVYGRLAQVHAVYLYPKDRSSRFVEFAAMFQADARQASDLLRDNYGYGVRFDDRLGASGTPYLDITVVKSKYTYRQLSSSRQFSLVRDELTLKLPDHSKKYAVWLDADSRYCGQANLYQDTQRTVDNANEKNRTTAIVYRPYSPSDPSTGGFCRGRTLLHEVGHNLGALQKVAPHAFDGAHCNDDDNDAMCYTAESTFASPGIGKFDWNNDDYWDAKADVVDPPSAPKDNLGWWTVNLSKFICPPLAGGTTPDCASLNSPDYSYPGS